MADLDKATREQLWKDPDWTCPKCGCVNFAIRNRCRNFWCDFDWDVNGGEGILVGICEVEDPMADLTAVTHESYDGPVCEKCGAVLTCLSCRGGVADPEHELRHLNNWLTDRLKALWPMKDTGDDVFTDILTIRMLMREAYSLGAQRKEAAAPTKAEPVCQCGHVHFGHEVCLYCECDEFVSPAAKEGQ